MSPRKMRLPELHDSLPDAVLEIDALLAPGTVDQTVEITGEAWARLVGLSRDVPRSLVGRACGKGVLEFVTDLEHLLNLPTPSDLADVLKAVERIKELDALRASTAAAERIELVNVELALSAAPDAKLSPAAMTWRRRIVDAFAANVADRDRLAADYNVVAAELTSLRAFVADVQTALGSTTAESLPATLKAVRELYERDLSPAEPKFEPVPPPKKKPRARGKKMFCGTCGLDTKHDGNDECTKCATAKPPGDAQIDLESAIGGES